MYGTDSGPCKSFITSDRRQTRGGGKVPYRDEILHGDVQDVRMGLTAAEGLLSGELLSEPHPHRVARFVLLEHL
jgi:hypothetical protein